MSGITTTISARSLLTREGFLERPLISVENGFVAAIGTDAGSAEHHFHDAVLLPAFVDVHVHGGAGHDLMETEGDALGHVSAFLATHGVGAFLPTTVTAPIESTLRALEVLARGIDFWNQEAETCATPLGIHLEGPFLSHAKRGVHSPSLLQEPSVDLFDRFWQAAEGRIRLMTVAPELPGALELIAHATALGVRCSMGHSNATWDDCIAGRAAGAISATHTFNAMSGMDHRSPGLTAFVLEQRDLFAELIADGYHVHPAMVRLIQRSVREDRLLLITDGISATGMPEGHYKLGDLDVEVRDGKCSSGGAIAGSVLTMDRAVRNLMEFTSAGPGIAGWAAGRNPAALLGAGDRHGSIEVGRPANITVLSPEGELRATFLGGRPV